jgi:hypothetical protein
MPYVDYFEGKHSKELWTLQVPIMWYYGEGAVSDQINSYRFNALGYRDDEFSEVDLLIAGCSVTFGEGIPEDRIWGNVLAEKMNITRKANIGHRGGSVYSILMYSMAYIKKYGKPKYVFCLFPDLSRLNIPLSLGIAADYSEPFKDPNKGSIVNIPIKNLTDKSEAPKYMKSPYNLSKIIPVDVAIHQAMMQINVFSMYCAEAGIKFMWSTWDESFNDLIKEFKSEFPEYIDYLNDYSVKDNTCHSELLDKYGLNFYRGLDNLDNKVPHHQGIHEHTHIAEAFYNSLK